MFNTCDHKHYATWRQVCTLEGVLALVRLFQRFTFSLNDQKHGGKPLEHESLITLMPKVRGMLQRSQTLVTSISPHHDDCSLSLEQELSTQHRSMMLLLVMSLAMSVFTPVWLAMHHLLRISRLCCITQAFWQYSKDHAVVVQGGVWLNVHLRR